MIKYPSLERSERLYPNNILLGKLIYWTEKRDGSNCGAYLKGFGLFFRSRHQEIASQDILQSIINTGYDDILYSCLCEQNVMIFFELLQKGKSPTHIEFHNKDDLAIFDIFDLKTETWLSYPEVFKLCQKYNLPIVVLYAMSRHLNMKTFEKFRLRMLKHAKKHQREGIVGKVYDIPIFFKEKLDLPSLKKKKNITHILPSLPVSEIQGAVNKAYIDLGIVDFKRKEISMPLIARYANEEAKKHLCNPSKKLFEFYLEKLKDLE